MAVDVRITTQIVGDAQARTALKGISNSVERTEQQAKKATSSFSGLAKSMRALAPALAAGTVVAGLTKIIKVTSDAQEVASKFDAVFKDLSSVTREWAATTAEALNRSRFDFEKYLATLQDTFVPLGFARDQAAELSKTLTQLGVDLASFNNESEPETINALTSAIVGNVEAVRRYGIVITQATLNQELLNQGVAGGVKEATEQEKALARLNIIMASTRDAQGDAARTSESFANQMKGLEAAVQEVLVALGETGLLAAATAVVNVISSMARTIADVVRAFNEFGDTASSIFDSVGDAAKTALAAINPLAQAYNVYTEIVEESTGELEKAAETTTAVAEATKELTVSTEDAAIAAEKLATAQKLAELEALDVIETNRIQAQTIKEIEQAQRDQAKEAKRAAAEAVEAAKESEQRAKDECTFIESVDECGNKVRKRRKAEDKRFRRETIADLGFIKVTACREIQEQVRCTKAGQVSIESGFKQTFERIATSTGSLGDRMRSVFDTAVSGVQRALAKLAADAIWKVITTVVSPSGGTQFAANLVSGSRALRSSGGIPTSIVDCGGRSGSNCGFANLPIIAQAVTSGGGGGGGSILPGLFGLAGTAIGSFFGPAGAAIGGLAGKFIGGQFFPEGFQRGGDFVTQGRRTITVGETGPERVRISPLGVPAPNVGATVVLQGPTIFNEITLRQFTRRLDRELGRRSLRRV